MNKHPRNHTDANVNPQQANPTPSTITGFFAGWAVLGGISHTNNLASTLSTIDSLALAARVAEAGPTMLILFLALRLALSSDLLRTPSVRILSRRRLSRQNPSIATRLTEARSQPKPTHFGDNPSYGYATNF